MIFGVGQIYRVTAVRPFDAICYCMPNGLVGIILVIMFQMLLSGFDMRFLYVFVTLMNAWPIKYLTV